MRVLLVYGRCILRLEVVLYALEMLEGMRRVLLCMLEVPEALEELEVSEAVEGSSVCWIVFEVLEMLEVMRCVLHCMLEAVEVSKFAAGVRGVRCSRCEVFEV